MIHTARRYMVTDVATIDELADQFFGEISTWTGCTGFRWSTWLFLNDSISEDGAQEYAVVREETMEQWESLTISWMEREVFIRVVGELDLELFPGGYEYGPIANQLDPPEEHRQVHCHLCA